MVEDLVELADHQDQTVALRCLIILNLQVVAAEDLALASPAAVVLVVAAVQLFPTYLLLVVLATHRQFPLHKETAVELVVKVEIIISDLVVAAVLVLLDKIQTLTVLDKAAMAVLVLHLVFLAAASLMLAVAGGRHIWELLE